MAFDFCNFIEYGSPFHTSFVDRLSPDDSASSSAHSPDLHYDTSSEGLHVSPPPFSFDLPQEAGFQPGDVFASTSPSPSISPPANPTNIDPVLKRKRRRPEEETEEEKMAREALLRAKNRESAKRSRKKRAVIVENLAHSEASLRTRNDDLQRQLLTLTEKYNKLLEENERLKCQLQFHTNHASVNSPPPTNAAGFGDRLTCSGLTMLPVFALVAIICVCLCVFIAPVGFSSLSPSSSLTAAPTFFHQSVKLPTIALQQNANTAVRLPTGSSVAGASSSSGYALPPNERRALRQHVRQKKLGNLTQPSTRIEVNDNNERPKAKLPLREIGKVRLLRALNGTVVSKDHGVIFLPYSAPVQAVGTEIARRRDVLDDSNRPIHPRAAMLVLPLDNGLLQGIIQDRPRDWDFHARTFATCFTSTLMKCYKQLEQQTGGPPQPSKSSTTPGMGQPSPTTPSKRVIFLPPDVHKLLPNATSTDDDQKNEKSVPIDQSEKMEIVQTNHQYQALHLTPDHGTLDFNLLASDSANQLPLLVYVY